MTAEERYMVAGAAGMVGVVEDMVDFAEVEWGDRAGFVEGGMVDFVDEGRAGLAEDKGFVEEDRVDSEGEGRVDMHTWAVQHMLQDR